ncbi:MAG: NERD domain-containing protein [Euryarchaeota archaeon]|nr:NERD domain-containing protein [Euryarchaeota archaeon]
MLPIVIQYGCSGAEKDLIELARKSGLSIICLNDIDSLAIDLKNQYGEKRIEVRVQIKQERNDLRSAIQHLNNDIDSQFVQLIDEINMEINTLQKDIRELLAIKFSLKNTFTCLSSRLKVFKKNRRLNYLEDDPQEEIDKQLENKYDHLKDLIRKQDHLENETDSEINYRLSSLVSQLDAVESIKRSNEYKGAVGEVRVMDELSKLSDEYYLFNDLHLKLNEWVHFNGSELRSAQIDHLVVGPTGVYVIETKNWRRQHIQQVFNDGSYTPYDQVQRHRYVVYRYMNGQKYGNTLQKLYFHLAKDEMKVKSILAIAGARIPYEKHNFVKVLYYIKIAEYIENGTEVLSPEVVRGVADGWMRTS